MFAEVIPYERFLEVRDRRRRIIVELVNQAKKTDGRRSDSGPEDAGKLELERGVIRVRVPQ